jgi:sterol desaturase/sphingolipid hydroxylase (fatty acid hydroxylase superfamily)
MHAITAASFPVVNAVLSHANHTRYDVRFTLFGYELYAAKNHDTHHRLGAKGGNYAQLFAGWDHLFGTFVEGSDLDSKKKSENADK